MKSRINVKRFLDFSAKGKALPQGIESVLGHFSAEWKAGRLEEQSAHLFVYIVDRMK